MFLCVLSLNSQVWVWSGSWREHPAWGRASPSASEFPRVLGSPPPLSFAAGRGEISEGTVSIKLISGWQTEKSKVKSDLVQLLVFLFVDLCQTLLALLVVQRQPLLVLKHLLLGLDFAHHVVKGLPEIIIKSSKNTSIPPLTDTKTNLILDSLLDDVFKLHSRFLCDNRR